MIALPHIIIGGGGHARVLAATLRAAGVEVHGYTDRSATMVASLPGVPFLGSDDVLAEQDPASVMLVNGVGSVGDTGPHQEIFQRFTQRGFRFATARHPAAFVASDAAIGVGAQLLLACVVQTGSTIGANAVINTAAVVDHDCVVGEHAHIAPGATLSGGVRVGEASHVGAGAVLLQGIEIGEHCVIGAGAVVTRNVAAGQTVVGVPARPVN